MPDYLKVDKSLVPLFIPLVGIFLWMADVSFSVRHIKEEILKLTADHEEQLVLKSDVQSLKTLVNRLLLDKMSYKGDMLFTKEELLVLGEQNG